MVCPENEDNNEAEMACSRGRLPEEALNTNNYSTYEEHNGEKNSWRAYKVEKDA
jgi:hypothetical protein